MSDVRANAHHWAYQEHWAPEDGDAACLLELRARVEALEANTRQWRIDHLRLANTCASMAPDRVRFFAQLMPDDTDSEGEQPSLKEQALDAHNRMMAGTETQDDWTIVRRALKALND